MTQKRFRCVVTLVQVKDVAAVYNLLCVAEHNIKRGPSFSLARTVCHVFRHKMMI